MIIQGKGRTPDCPFDQWFFEVDSASNATWTTEEIVIVNESFSACLQRWQQHQGHYWSSNFYHFEKQERSDGPFYRAYKPTWNITGSHLFGRTPAILMKLIEEQFR